MEQRLTPTRLEQRTRCAPAWLAASAVAVAAQFYGLYRPSGPPAPPWFPAADKVGHLLGFAIPVGLVSITLERYGRVGRRAGVVVLALFAAQAVVSELVQGAFYRYRSGDPYDLLADLAGMLLGWFGYRRWRRRAAA